MLTVKYQKNIRLSHLRKRNPNHGGNELTQKTRILEKQKINLPNNFLKYLKPWSPPAGKLPA
jgi:hypothetical protein